jgi:2-polyprenyl-6-hydroxyphenyl methylase/3-demethylubiquinone-9 3-methyltransferase
MANCKICGTGSLREYAVVNGFQIWKCRICGFGQTAITFEDTRQFYDPQYFSGGKARFSQAMDDEIPPSKRWWIDRYVSGKSKNVLEIGPGPAAMLGRYLATTRADISYEAVELSGFACDAVRRAGFHVYNGTIYTSDVEAVCRGRFDTVIATEVIEHDPDPRRFAQGMFDALKPGGAACLTTGNFDGIMARIKKDKWYYLDPPAHPVYYTPKSITRLLRGVGFSDVNVECIGSNYVELYLRYPIPGLLQFVQMIRLPTGMTVVATR